MAIISTTADENAILPARMDEYSASEQADFDKLNKAFIEAICGIVASENNKQKENIIKSYRDLFLNYVRAGGALNLCSIDVLLDEDRSMYISHLKDIPAKRLRQAPIWFASLCLVELSLQGVSNLQKRQKNLSDLFLALDNASLSFKLLIKDSAPITGSRSFTGLACMYGLWATGVWVAKLDPFMKSAEVSVYYSCIESSSVAKKVDLAITVMEAMYELDKDIDRASSMNGLTALIRAAAYTNVPMCAWLLAHGADINKPDSANQATPIMHALDRKFGIGDFSNRKRIKETLDFLIENGADLTLTPLTGEEFGKLIINCLSLKGEDRKYYKEFWKNYKKTLPISTKKDLSNSVTITNLVTPQDMIDFDMRSRFLQTANYDQMLIKLICFLVYEKNILQFTFMDIMTLLAWVENGSRRDLSKANIEKQLNKLISGKKVYLNITKDRDTGFFVVLSDSLEPNVISGKHL